MYYKVNMKTNKYTVTKANKNSRNIVHPTKSSYLALPTIQMAVVHICIGND